MSIHLLVTTTDTTIESESKSDSDSPLYPHRHNTQHLELMDDPTPFSSTDTTNFFLLDSFFLPFFNDKSPPSDDDWNLIFDSILPSIKITAAFLEGDEEDPLLVCAVCKDEFVMDVDAKLLPCNHLFHPECILPWLNSNHNSCPLCRFQLLLPSKSDISSAVPTSESSSRISYPRLRDMMDCTGSFHHYQEDDDALDSSFPDVGALSNFLPSHF